MSETLKSTEDRVERSSSATISVVTPTLWRPLEVAGLLNNLEQQFLLPHEIIIIDGAEPDQSHTAEVVAWKAPSLLFPCHYLRARGGTAIQRNVGIEAATGDLIAFIDDDIRLEPDFFRVIADLFGRDHQGRVGGVVGYRTNEHFRPDDVRRWRWYRRLRLLTTFEPGHYDFRSGYPINANAQPPFRGVREVDFMTTSCAVWRREIFSSLRFDPFFRDYGVLEDAHFSLRARRNWRLLQCGDARCEHHHAPGGRAGSRNIGYKSVVNYYYVFNDVASPLTWRKQFRFWRFQSFELFRMVASAVFRRRSSDLLDVLGRLEGFAAVASGRYRKSRTS